MHLIDKNDLIKEVVVRRVLLPALWRQRDTLVIFLRWHKNKFYDTSSNVEKTFLVFSRHFYVTDKYLHPEQLMRSRPFPCFFSDGNVFIYLFIELYFKGIGFTTF